MTENIVFDEFTEDRIIEGASVLFQVALEVAEEFTKDHTQYEADFGDINEWVSKLVELALPMTKIADSLPLEQLLSFQGFLDKFVHRFELAIEEAKAKEGVLH